MPDCSLSLPSVSVVLPSYTELQFVGRYLPMENSQSPCCLPIQKHSLRGVVFLYRNTVSVVLSSYAGQSPWCCLPIRKHSLRGVVFLCGTAVSLMLSFYTKLKSQERTPQNGSLCRFDVRYRAVVSGVLSSYTEL